ncbi:MAG: hypothetical protein KA257_08120 [Opitutaceae bacterium]|nr:hypothetical protein [Opitutaceae bacterium]
MHRLLALLFFPAVLLAQTAATLPPSVQVIATTPDPADRLHAQQSLYLRVAYASDQPLKLQATGWFQGKKGGSFMMNASPAYPAGKGEALVWIAGAAGARADEIRINVADAQWRPIFVLSVPVQAEWHAGVPSAPEAPWARELAVAQQTAISAAIQQPAESGGIFHKIWLALTTLLVPIAFLAVPGYPIMQLIAVIKLRGPARLLSCLPVCFMLPVYAFCLYALSQQSNLWPLYALFASPVALVITLTVFIVARRRQRPAPTA